MTERRQTKNFICKKRGKLGKKILLYNKNYILTCFLVTLTKSCQMIIIKTTMSSLA